MTIHFAFYGRVSTEDRQDPAASEQWQLDAAVRLIAPAPHSGVIVERFFDVNVSRSMPWRRRPEAARLLDKLRDRSRLWTDVVVGEPARAFMGGQHDEVIPTMSHYDVRLWLPPLNGPFDPSNMGHDMTMAVYGMQAKSERFATQKRVADSMRSLAATSDRHMGGRPPYGYRLADAGEHPNPSRRSDGRRVHRLEPDPVTGPAVQLIFALYLEGRSLRAIAEHLVRAGHPSPSAHDRARNQHRSGVGWAISAISAILRNERYTGVQVFGKQPRAYRLLDPEQPSLGTRKVQEWAERDTWVVTSQQMHEPLVSPEDFALAQARRTASGHPAKPRPKPGQVPYVFAGRIRCAACRRRMEAGRARYTTRYRCRVRLDYVMDPSVDHPNNLQVGEAPLVAAVDAWIASAFHPDNLSATAASLAQAADDSELKHRADACRQAIATEELALGRYKTLALQGDLESVAEWIAEAEAKKRLASAELMRLNQALAAEPASVLAMLTALGDLTRVIREAAPEDRRALYDALGLQAVYDHRRNTVEVECSIGIPRRGNRSCPRGDLNPHAR